MRRKFDPLMYVGSAVILAEALVLTGIHAINSQAKTPEIVLATVPAVIEEPAPTIIIHPEIQIPPATAAVVEITEAPPVEETVPALQETPLGSFKLTAYCGCRKCCGNGSG